LILAAVADSFGWASGYTCANETPVEPAVHATRGREQPACIAYESPEVDPHPKKTSGPDERSAQGVRALLRNLISIGSRLL
jgi:hypothetical protein